MYEQPTIPKLGKNSWRTIYDNASDFYQQKPWQYMSDRDLFGIELPQSKELVFGSIMGAGGLTFGYCIYLGLDGLTFFEILKSGFYDESDPDLMKKHNAVLIEYVDKDALDEHDIKVAKSLNFKPKDQNGWMFIREVLSGYFPWFLSEKYVDTILTFFEVLPIFIDKMKQNPEFSYGKVGKSYPIFKKKENGQWEVVRKTKKKLVDATKQDPLSKYLQSIDEATLTRINSYNLPKKAGWQVGSFYLPEPVLDKERPFYLKVVAAIEEGSGFCLDCETINPEVQENAMFIKLIINLIEKHKYLPKTIETSSAHIYLGLSDLKELGIELKLNMLMDSFEEFKEKAILACTENNPPYSSLEI